MLKDCRPFLWLWAAIIGLAFGCGKTLPDWKVPPPVDVRAILGAIMEQADEDRSGWLDGDELLIIPALQTSLGVLDSNSDKKLSRDEIEAWLERLKKDGIARQDAPANVYFRGKPVAKARVKLVPEACMGGTIEPAEGTTDEQGMVFPTIQTAGVMGVRCGLYRLEVVGKQANGKPIPAKYGKDSPVGYAVGGGLPDSWHPKVFLD